MTWHADTPDLVCPGCGEPVARQAPVWTPAWGPVPAFSHLDGEPLCPVIGPQGYQPAEPTARPHTPTDVTGTDGEPLTGPVAGPSVTGPERR